MKLNFKMLIFCFLLSGCANTDKYHPPEGIETSKLATVYIYRTNVSFHSLDPEKPFFYLNDRLIAKLGTGRFKKIQIPEGNNKFSVRQSILFMPGVESNKFSYVFEAGKTYYLRYSENFNALTFAGSSAYTSGSRHFSLTNKENFDRLQ